MRHLKDQSVKVMKHGEQRYDTAGDWLWLKGIDWYGITKLPLGWKAEQALLTHEMIEANLCREAGITEEAVSHFDTVTVFEVDPKNANDPGRSKFAPYHEQHMIATKIEKYIIKTLGLDWKQYDQDYDKLKWR